MRVLTSVGDVLGPCENIRLKKARLRSLAGEQLIISNHDLVSSRIHNYKRMNERRVVFSLGVTYETPPDRLNHMPDMIREAVERVLLEEGPERFKRFSREVIEEGRRSFKARRAACTKSRAVGRGGWSPSRKPLEAAAKTAPSVGPAF